MNHGVTEVPLARTVSQRPSTPSNVVTRPRTTSLRPSDVSSCYRRDYLRTTVGTSARVFGDGVSFGN